jgi:hypothetical protein
MPRFLKILLAFLSGLIAGEAIPIVWYIVATNYFGLFDREGGGEMGAIFILGPILALLLGVVAACDGHTNRLSGSLVAGAAFRIIGGSARRAYFRPVP